MSEGRGSLVHLSRCVSWPGWSLEEKCVALRKKEHVKETYWFIITPHRSLPS